MDRRVDKRKGKGRYRGETDGAWVEMNRKEYRGAEARARTVAVCVPLPFVAKTVPLPCVFTSFAAETVPLPWCVFPLPFDAKTPPLPCGLPQVTSSLVFGNAMKVGTSHCLSSTSYCLPFLDLLPPSHCLSSTVHAPSPPLPFLLTVCRHPH